jgi:undecaprenyl-diphosphatase
VTWVQGIVLGMVQGITEFLPVSSDGHLVLAQHFLHAATPGVFVEVLLHVATLGAVLIVYGRPLVDLTRGVITRQPEALEYAGLLVVATIPAVIVALVFDDLLERVFDSLAVAGAGFVVTGLALWSSRGRAGGRHVPTWQQALIIGVGQALAILPGVSRSGLTVAAALVAGLAPVSAAKFSFLMAVPAISGAAVLQAGDAAAGIAAVGPGPLLLSCAVALVSGVWAIRWLLLLISHGRFHSFAPYCWALGALTLGLALWRG